MNKYSTADRVKIIGVISAICIVSSICGYFILGPLLVGGESVDQFRSRLIASENQYLTRPDNKVCQKIADAHVTVTVTSATVSACRVYTVDGSNKAGKNDSNISEIDIVYTVNWHGIIQKNGFTEFELDYDYINKKVKDAKYLRSNALINLDTVDWFGVGEELGALIASL